MVENFHILVGSLRIFLLAFIAHKCLQLSLKNAKQSTILLTFVHEGQKMFSNDDLNLFSVFRLYLFSLDFRFVIQLVAPIPVFFGLFHFSIKTCVFLVGLDKAGGDGGSSGGQSGFSRSRSSSMSSLERADCSDAIQYITFMYSYPTRNGKLRI